MVTIKNRECMELSLNDKQNWVKQRTGMGIPETQIIQVMNDHHLVLEQPWWLGDPPFLEPIYIYIYMIYIYIFLYT